MRLSHLVPLVFIPILMAVGCSKKSDADRIQSLEAELSRLKAGQDQITPPPTNLKRPSEADLLLVGEMLADNTIGSSAGDKRSRFLKPISVTIKDVSTEGPMCHVVFDLKVEYLPPFKTISAITSEATNEATPSLIGYLQTSYGTSIAADGASGYMIDKTWLARQQQYQGLYINGVKVLMRKWDTGWKFVALDR